MFKKEKNTNFIERSLKTRVSRAPRRWQRVFVVDPPGVHGIHPNPARVAVVEGRRTRHHVQGRFRHVSVGMG